MKVAQLEIELLANVARLSNDLRRAERETETRTARMARAARQIGLAFAAAGAAASTALATMVRSAINTMDETSKLAQQLGLTVEKLSALRYVADQSGVSVQQLSTVFVRLNRTMADAQRGVESASRGFRALGVNVVDSTGRLRDNDAVLLDIADAFSQMEDGAKKTAIAYEILGRSGAVMIPFLNAGREGIQELREEAERLGLVFSTETAQAAERFNGNLTRLSRAKDGIIYRIAEQMIPFLEDMSQAMLDAAGDANQMREAARALEAMLRGLVGTGALVAAIFDLVAEVIATAVSSIYLLVRGELDAAMAAVEIGADNMVNKFQDHMDRLTWIWVEAGNTLGEPMEIDMGGTTEEVANDTARAVGRATKAMDEFAKARERDLQTQYQQISAIQEQALALEDQNEVYGMSQEAIEELAVARLQDQIAILEGFDGSEKQIELIELEIKARQRLIAAMKGRDRLEAQAEARRAAEAAGKAAEREWERTAERIEQDLTDALMRGFESGADFGQNLRDTLENYFKTMVIRPIIQPIVQDAVGAIGGAIGGSGAAGSFGGIGPIGNIVGTIGQALTGGMVGASAGSLAFGNVVGALGGDALGAFIGANAGWSGVGTAAGAAMGAISTALPWIGVGLTAYSLLKDAFSGETRYGAGYGIGHEGIAIRSGGPSGGDPHEAASRQAIEQTWAAVNELANTLGGSLAGWTMGAGWELSPEKGRSFVWTDIVGPGEFVSHTEGIGRRDLPGVKDGDVVLQEFQAELQRTIIRGLQLADVDEHWREWLDQFDVDQLDAAGVQSVIAMIEALTQLQQAARDMGMAQLADATAQAQANIIELSGGIENFSSNLSTYYQAFYSEAERTANLTATLTRVVGELGYELPRTHAEFRALVEAQDLTTEAGQQAYATLISIAGAFDQLVNAAGGASAAFAEQQMRVTELAEEVNRLLGARNRAGTVLDQIDRAMGRTGAFSQQREAELWAAMGTASYEQQIELAGELTDLVLDRYQTEIEAAERLQELGRSLRDYVQSLLTGDMSPLTLGERLAEAGAQYQTLLAQAQAGDEGAMAQLQGAADAYLQLARDYYASSDEYTRIFGYITGSLDALGIQAESEAERQLSVSESSLSELMDIRSVAERAYNVLDRQYQTALNDLQSETALLAEIGADTGELHTIADLLAGLPAEIAGHLQGILGGASGGVVQGWYQGAGMTPDQDAIDYWSGQLQQRPGDEVRQDYLNTLVANWYRDNLGWAPDPQGLEYWVNQAREIGAAAAYEDFLRTATPHFNGLDYVPYDDYPAMLHRGERIMSAADVRNDSDMLDELRSLRQEVSQFRAESRQGTHALINSEQGAADKIAGAFRTREETNTWERRKSRYGVPA